MHAILKKIHINIPLIVSTIVGILVLELIVRDGFWSPVFWAFIGTIVFLEIYFTSIVKMMLSSKKKYPFLTFFGHLSAFSFLTIFLFALMFSKFTGAGNYLWSIVDQAAVSGFDNAFYFSGVTMLSIGYGDIVPYGFFRLLALIEGFIGSFVILSFFSLGVSQIFLQIKSDLEQEEKELKKDTENLEELEKELNKK